MKTMGVRLIVRPREAPFAAAPGFHEGRADGLAESGAVEDEWTFEFEQDRVLLGRGSGVDVSLPDRSISSRHASLRVEASSRVVLSVSSACSRYSSEYSVCMAASGCTLCARRMVAGLASHRPSARTLPWSMSRAMAPTVSSIGTLGSMRCT